MSEWQPIETAPKDGKILAWCPQRGVCAPAYWNEDKYAKNPRPYWTHWGERMCGTLATRKDQPTHWMPLPEPPEVS
jgi:hypothetical protein